MKAIASIIRHRLLSIPVIGLMAAAELAPPAVKSATVITTVLLSLSSTPEAQALPVHSVARRTVRRTTRRVVRRHMFGLPAGAALFPFGAYRYYRYAGLYYYPYMIGGRTTYIQVDVDAGGNPLPPPPASQVETEIDF